MLSKDDILKAKDLTVKEVEVPEWGGSVYIKSLTGTERDLYESSITQIKGKEAKLDWRNARAKLLVFTICDQDGNRLFNESEIGELGKKSASALQRLFDVATEMNGLSSTSEEELEKN